MKHKRQTLTKEDGDDKDGGSSDGLEKSKSDKLLGLDEDEKKSCHNCDISGVGDVGSTLSGDVTELTSVRGGNSNNNTPSATNNNSFNANSNGASSVGSTNSVSSTFDKMMVDEDSRSHDSSDVTSPSLSSKKLDVRVKVEADHKSPNATKQQQISISKKSPSSSGKDMCSVTSNGVLLALPDSTVGTPTLQNQQGSSTRSLTPSSTPGTPASVHLQGSPLSMQQATHGVYMQRPRSSPSSSTSGGNVQTNLLHSGNNPTGAISPHNRNPQSHFQQGVYHQTPASIDYRNGGQAVNRQAVPIGNQQNAYCSREATYHQQRISYASEMHPQYARQSQTMNRVNHHTRTGSGRSMYNHHSMQQFHQQHNQYGNTAAYNGYAQSGTYHASYHAR